MPNYYEALGLDEEATESDIKGAYYRLVREYRPQEHPDEFRRFSDASRTLSDPRRRGAYDQNRRNGRRVRVLVDQAAKAQDKDPQKAIALLKNAIALAPDVARPRLLLAQTLMRIEEYAAAEKQYRWLIKENTHDETLHFKLARCLWLQGRPEDSRSDLERALRINARYHDAMMLLARLEEQSGNPVRAAELLERAIANDGKENLADADAILRLLILYLINEDREEADRSARRLLQILPADDTESVGKVVLRILQRANELYQAESFRAAKRLLEIAAEGAAVGVEEPEEIAEKIETLRRAVFLRSEARQIQSDTLVYGALKTFLELRYLERTPEAVRQKLDVLLTRLQSEVAAQARDLCAVIEYLRGEYPMIAADQERLLAELHDRATRRLAAESLMLGDTLAMPEARGEETAAPGKKGLFGWLRGGSK